MTGGDNIILVSGSPRGNSNTERMLNAVLDVTGGELIRVTDHKIKPCTSCRFCVENKGCCIDDDMQELYLKLLNADAIILGTPVYFNNVSAQLKAFMDRTWCLRGSLKNKIAGAVAVGRGYGLEGALTALNSFFLKHEMLVANRGVSTSAFDVGELDDDALDDCRKLGERVIELKKNRKTV